MTYAKTTLRPKKGNYSSLVGLKVSNSIIQPALVYGLASDHDSLAHDLVQIAKDPIDSIPMHVSKVTGTIIQHSNAIGNV